MGLFRYKIRCENDSIPGMLIEEIGSTTRYEPCYYPLTQLDTDMAKIQKDFKWFSSAMDNTDITKQLVYPDFTRRFPKKSIGKLSMFNGGT